MSTTGDFACPTCQAEPTEDCRSQAKRKTKTHIKYYHRERMRLYEAQQYHQSWEHRANGEASDKIRTGVRPTIDDLEALANACRAIIELPMAPFDDVVLDHWLDALNALNLLQDGAVSTGILYKFQRWEYERPGGRLDQLARQVQQQAIADGPPSPDHLWSDEPRGYYLARRMGLKLHRERKDTRQWWVEGRVEGQDLAAGKFSKVLAWLEEEYTMSTTRDNTTEGDR